MGLYLGIDTSNYTTSTAIYDSESGTVVSKKKLLPVSPGEKGLRQSDAVFAHVKQLSELVCEAVSEANAGGRLCGVCSSISPRTVEGSYMPAFLVGKMAGEIIAYSSNIPFHSCSHQEGHLMAAIYGADKRQLLKNEFYCFHVSGGTTECLLISPKGRLFDITILAKTLDLNAGQLIDRTGVMLSLPFPCGKHLDKLAQDCQDDADKMGISIRLNGLDCNLSGYENKANELFQKEFSPEYISRFIIEAVKNTVAKMSGGVLKKYGRKPFLYMGGVMSNTIIRKSLEKEGESFFAPPEFSCDNAAGAAIIGFVKSHNEEELE